VQGHYSRLCKLLPGCLITEAEAQLVLLSALWPEGTRCYYYFKFSQGIEKLLVARNMM
jgi:3-hydroxymyristoyl/3-hydroxydecanoyl-(acyl carrier protein) dehydratase